MLVCKQNNEVVASGGCVVLNDTDCLLKRFYIKKELRGTGLAQEFFKEIVQNAKQLKSSRMVLDVSRNNARVIRFYEKLGFIKYNQTPIKNWIESFFPDNYYYYSLKI